MRGHGTQTFLNHFSVVLGTLIGVTWYKQTRALVRGKLEWSAAVLGCLALFYARSPAAYVAMLGVAFGAGWFKQSRTRGKAQGLDCAQRPGNC